MLTKPQIMKKFEIDPQTNDANLIDEIQGVGFVHGTTGQFGAGKFEGDTWFNAVGMDIDFVETRLGLANDEIFNLYTAAHAEGRAQAKKDKKADQSAEPA